MLRSPLLARENLDRVFKAYDLRGRVPDQLDEPLADAVGAAFVTVTGAPAVVVGHDMRESSPGLAAAFAQGAARAGAQVTAIGLASTDQLYFASGSLQQAGAMVTASHNPAGDNGLKLCRPGARPVGWDTGLRELRDLVADGDLPAADTPGRITSRDLLAPYAEHLLALVPLATPPTALRIVVDAGNGMAGHTAPAVLGRLHRQVSVVPLYFELDGTFPNHEANPIEPENLRDLQRRVLDEGADLGLAFDGDADRCFFVDERGALVSPSTITALIAARALARDPGATVIHNLITSRAVPEIVRELGGHPVRTRVGHSFIKDTMAQTGAVFGGEHSGHYYFRDFWRADSGMLAALHVLAALTETGRPASQLLASYQRYAASGEINTSVTDAARVLSRVEEHFASVPGVEIDHLDGTTVSHPDWSFNVRPSNTESLLRLNAEGADEAAMQAVRDAVLTLIRSDA